MTGFLSAVTIGLETCHSTKEWFSKATKLKNQHPDQKVHIVHGDIIKCYALSIGERNWNHIKVQDRGSLQLETCNCECHKFLHQPLELNYLEKYVKRRESANLSERYWLQLPGCKGCRSDPYQNISCNCRCTCFRCHKASDQLHESKTNSSAVYYNLGHVEAASVKSTGYYSRCHNRSHHSETVCLALALFQHYKQAIATGAAFMHKSSALSQKTISCSSKHPSMFHGYKSTCHRNKMVSVTKCNQQTQCDDYKTENSFDHKSTQTYTKVCEIGVSGTRSLFNAIIQTENIVVDSSLQVSPETSEAEAQTEPITNISLRLPVPTTGTTHFMPQGDYVSTEHAISSHCECLEVITESNSKEVKHSSSQISPESVDAEVQVCVTFVDSSLQTSPESADCEIQAEIPSPQIRIFEEKLNSMKSQLGRVMQEKEALREELKSMREREKQDTEYLATWQTRKNSGISISELHSVL